MRTLKSLASLRKVGVDKVDWHDKEKNIYDEDVDVLYTFRFLGIKLFEYNKILDTKHSFDKEKGAPSVTGFRTNDSKK